MDIEKKLNLSQYLSLYGALLTEHQAEMLRLYYDCDISLFEISEQFGISRQAVRDAIVRGEKSLVEFENKLGLRKILTKVKSGLENLLSDIPADLDLIADEVKALIDKLEE